VNKIVGGVGTVVGMVGGEKKEPTPSVGVDGEEEVIPNSPSTKEEHLLKFPYRIVIRTNPEQVSSLSIYPVYIPLSHSLSLSMYPVPLPVYLSLYP